MRYLVLVVHDGWRWLSGLAAMGCGEIGARRSDALETGGEGYRTVVISARKVLDVEDVANLLTLVGVAKKDELVVFAHRPHRGGCSAENVEVAAGRVGCTVEARIFSAEDTGSYPCQLCDEMESYLRANRGELLGFSFPSWRRIKTGSAQEFERVKLRGLLHEFRYFRHEAGHVVLPVDIDLQGLKEAGFAADYWGEIKKAWGCPDNPHPFCEMASMVYEEAGRGRSLSGLVDAGTEALRSRPRFLSTAEILERAWTTARSLLPREPDASEVSEVFVKASGVVAQVREIKFAIDERLSALDPGAFSNWLREWNKALDEIEDCLRILQ